MEIQSWVPLVSGIATALLVSLSVALVASQVERKRKKEAPSLEDRITALAKSLKSSLSVISEIESEIASRSQIASKLKADVKRYEKLKELNAAQVDAIAQTIRGEIAGESKKSLLRNALITFGVAMIFFFLGFWLRGA